MTNTATPELPIVRERWQLKNDHSRIAKVVYVEIDDVKSLRGYVLIKAPWMRCYPTAAGKSLDTFIKQYEKVTKE